MSFPESAMTSSPNDEGRMRRFFFQHPKQSIGAAMGLTFLALLPRVDLLGQGAIPVLQALSPVFCLAAVIVATAMALGGRWFPAILLLSGSLLCMAPSLVPLSEVPTASSESPMQVFSINVEHSRADIGALAEVIEEHHVEVAVLVEVDERFIRNLLSSGVKQLLPYRSQAVTPGDTAGTVILSKYPMNREIRIPMADDIVTFDHPSAVIDHPRYGMVRVAAVHPHAPVVDRAHKWKSILESIDAWQATQTGMPLVMAGDFNASRAHPAFRELSSTFVDTSAASGIFPTPTWPAAGSVPAFVAIDHVLVRGLTAAGWQRIAIPGTDHYGIIAAVTSVEVENH